MFQKEIEWRDKVRHIDYYYYYFVACFHRPFFPATSLPETMAIPQRSDFKLQTAVLSFIFLTFKVSLPFVVNPLNVSLAWLPNFS